MFFKIYAGLGGGFGGATYHETIECGDENEALDYARQLACDDYEMYAGLHGIRDYDDIYQEMVDEGIDEEDIDESDIELEYEEERESWIDYYVEEAESIDDIE